MRVEIMPSGSKGFVKGQSGNPSGKKKDGSERTGYKKKARLKVQEILDMLDFRPFEEMVALYRNDETEPRVKIDILTELCSYIAPKLKSVEVTGDTDKPFNVILNMAPNKNLPFLPAIDEVIEGEYNAT